MRRAPTSLIAFVVAIALHVVGFGAIIALSLLAAFIAPKTPLRAKPVEVSMRPISADQWAKNRGVRKDDMKQRGPSQELPPEETQNEPQQTPEEQVAEAPKPVEEKPKKKAEERPRGQTVATAPGNGEEDPDAEFLSESSNKTKRETRAKDQTPFYRNPSAKRTSPVPNHEAGNDEVDKAQREGNNGAGQDDRPLREPSERKLALEIPDMHAREQVQLEQEEKDGPGPSVANRQESAEVHGNSKRLRIQDGAPTPGADASRGKAGTPGIATLTPSISVLDKVYGGAPSDHLDVDEGDGTYLNTREWKYAGFMNRVKQSVGMTWDPIRELHMRDPTGNTYAGRDRQTVLQVTLDERGRVKDVFVLKSSGLDFLDLEAVRSFERAQPFPNPPSGMLSEKSTVTFNFGFFLDMGGGPGPGMFR